MLDKQTVIKSFFLVFVFIAVSFRVHPTQSLTVSSPISVSPIITSVHFFFGTSLLFYSYLLDRLAIISSLNTRAKHSLDLFSHYISGYAPVTHTPVPLVHQFWTPSNLITPSTSVRLGVQGPCSRWSVRNARADVSFVVSSPRRRQGRRSPFDDLHDYARPERDCISIR